MNQEEITKQLRQAPMDDARSLDRICEQKAAELIEAGTAPNYIVSSADFTGDALLICADRYWRRRFLAAPSVDTAVHCAVWMADHIATEHQQAVEEKWALGLSFITRDTVDVDTAVEATTCQIEQLGDQSMDAAYFTCLYQAGKLRANFDFEGLYRLTTYSRLAQACALRRMDPTLLALQAYAEFGSRTYTSEHALELMTQAWEHPSRSRAVMDVCLNGLAIAVPFDTQGESLRECAAKALAEHPDDHAFHYWLAIGHEMGGDYEAAGAAINEALRLLPAHGSRGSHTLLQEQYRQRRSAIHDGQRLTRRHREAEQHPSAQIASSAAHQPSPPTSAPAGNAPGKPWPLARLLGLFVPLMVLMLLVGQVVPRPAPGAGLGERAASLGILGAVLATTTLIFVICARIALVVRRD